MGLINEQIYEDLTNVVHDNLVHHRIIVAHIYVQWAF